MQLFKFSFLIVLLCFACVSDEKDNKRIYTGKAFELSLYPNQNVAHGDWLKLDTILLIHDKFSVTKYIDGIKTINDPSLVLRNHIKLKTSTYVIYKSAEREWEENASNNELILELALKTAALKNKDELIYKIHGGSKLLYEGKLVLSRQDRANFNITLSKEHPFNIKILE